jgi:serine phosphatase RsbU (regulator of sigma subunit)
MRFRLKSRKRALATEPVHATVPVLAAAEISAVYYGQRQAGDFYDFVRAGENRILFGLFDVAGVHDGNRAVITAAQQTFRTAGKKLFQSEELNESDAMVELGVQLNTAVMRAEGGVRACPAFVGCYHETLGSLCYVNAGHTPGILRDSTGMLDLPATGLPLGLFSHMTCDAPTVVLEPGAAMLLVSRGVVEARRKADEFGVLRVKQALQNLSSETAKQICVSVLQNVQQFMGTPPTHDDVTALALIRASQAAAAAQSS